jgi:hypothetical protein
MARIWVVAVLVLAMLAGCSDREPASADLQFQVGGREPAVIVPGDRPVVASAIFREDPDQGVFDLDFVDGATTWEARDVELTYHGIHQGWDEWGRSIPVFVFRYMPMVLEIDEIEITATGVELSGQWRPHLVEYLFDAADGRFIGAVDLDAEVRNFIDPSQRHALTWSYTSTLFLFMQWKALGGVPGSFEAFGMTYAMERYDGEPPVAGNCDAYQLVRVEPPPKGNRTTLVCLEKSSQVPLWAYSGQADEGMLFQRQGQGFGLPPFEGAALSPHVFDTAPWDTVAVEPQKPVHVAPAARRGDWAYELQERTRALYLQPEFMVYNLRHDDVYLFDAMTGWPPHTPLSLLDLVNPPTVPLRAKQTSWLMLTPDEGMFWGFVDTYSRPGDGEDLHVAQAKAYEFEGPLGRTYPSLEELPDVPCPAHSAHHPIFNASRIRRHRLGGLGVVLVGHRFLLRGSGGCAVCMVQRGHGPAHVGWPRAQLRERLLRGWRRHARPGWHGRLGRAAPRCIAGAGRGWPCHRGWQGAAR